MTKAVQSTRDLSNADPGTEGVVDRRLQLCERLSAWPFKELIRTCGDCSCYSLHCCHCDRRYADEVGSILYPDDCYEVNNCHHFRVVFCDGACRNNGDSSATAGVGLAWGNSKDQEFAVAVNEDEFGRLTSQRAELIAATQAVLLLKMHCDEPTKPHSRNEVEQYVGAKQGIIVTDSKYVVDGITSWIHSWKRRGWRTSTGKPPQNLDLFKRLDEAVLLMEGKGMKIGFHHVSREYNEQADRLAKRAAEKFR